MLVRIIPRDILQLLERGAITAVQSVIPLASFSNQKIPVGTEFDNVEAIKIEDDMFSKLQVSMVPSKQQVAPSILGLNKIAQSGKSNEWMFVRKRSLNVQLPKDTVTVLNFPRNVPIPPCPKGIESRSWKKAFEEATVYLIGTAHFSRKSVEDVTNTITETQPDLVMVELCPGRIPVLSMDEKTLLKEESELNTQKILTIIKQSGVVQGVLHILLLSLSAQIARKLSMAPGVECRAAHKAAMQTPLCRLVLGDRPIQVTLQRALGSLTLWEKFKFSWHLIVSHNTSITLEEVEKCKERDMMEQLLAEMASDFPKLSKVFVDERDAFMTHALHSLLISNTFHKRMSWEKHTGTNWQPLRVVAVVGIGHTPGIIAHWDEPVNISPLLSVPPPSKSAKIAKLAFRAALWGGVGFLLYQSGVRIAKKLS